MSFKCVNFKISLKLTPKSGTFGFFISLLFPFIGAVQKGYEGKTSV